MPSFEQIKSGALSAMLVVAAGCASEDVRPNLVMIVLDTVGPAHVSAYGYAQPTTPFLERFSERATLFERAYSTSCWTLPAHASAFTGLDVLRHGADQVTRRLPQGAQTLAERLVDAGYQTAGFSNNPWISHGRGTARGFESFAELFRQRSDRPGKVEKHPTVVQVADWLDSGHDSERPWFLFVNLIDAHYPYAPPREYALKFFESVRAWRRAAARLAALQPLNVIRLHYLEGLADASVTAADREAAHQLYDAEIRYLDDVVQVLVRDIESASNRPTLLAIVSDHGENFGEHGHMGHAFSLYDSSLRIVLLVSGPGFESGSRDQRLVQISDLFPTFLHAAGVPVPEGIDGVDLKTTGEDRGVRALYAHPKLAFSRFPKRYRDAEHFARFDRELRAGIAGRYKLIRGSDGSEEVFDIQADPDETRPLEDVPAEVLQQLRRLAGEPRPHAGAAPAEPEQLDDQTRTALEELGYLAKSEEE